MDFADFLNKQALVISERLEKVLTETSKKSGETDLQLGKLLEEFIKSSKDGKRIRGSLVLLGYQIAGGKDRENILDAAVAFEIFQTAILAQDDLIDKSLTRRNKPSLYSALGGDHKAISETICLSDIGFFTAYRLMSTLKVEDALKIKALNLFSQTLTQTVLGELLDIEAAFKNGDFLEEDSLKIALLKTARYTVSGPLMLGATLAGADMQFLKKLQVYGDNLGIAFQIQDDILGIFGDEETIGKSAASDIKERKATVLIAFAQSNANPKQKKTLEEYYGNEKIDDKGVGEVRKIFNETGALEYAKLVSEKYFNKAKQSLKEGEQEILYSLIEFLENRKK